MSVSKGLSTYAGLITALAQYLAAIALFLEADDQALALGPLATATATLLTVVAGRMWQANTLAAKVPTGLLAPYAAGVASSSTDREPSRWGGVTSSTGNVSGATFTQSRPGVEWTNPQPAKPNPYASSIPAGSVPAEDGQ